MRSTAALTGLILIGTALASAQTLNVKVADRKADVAGELRWEKMQSETYKILGVLDKPKDNN